MDEGDPNSGGLSRTATEGELSNALDRLGVDTAGLYQSHRRDDDAPIVGTSTLDHLVDAVEALEIDGSDSGLEYLSEPYEPAPVTGRD
jgi:aryl-alcohol dehydrogenase-like predicted oxidoreductase